MTPTHILKALNRHNLTQRELCIMTRISPSALSSFISGRLTLKTDQLKRIKTALDNLPEYSAMEMLSLHNEYEEHCRKIVPDFITWLKGKERL